MKIKAVAGNITCSIMIAFFCLSQVSCSVWTRGELGSEKGENKVNAFVSKIRTPQSNPDSHYLLAHYYQERGRHREAIEEFHKAILIEPLHVKAYNGLGVSHSELKDYSQAIQFFMTALKINPKLDYIHNNIGYCHLLQRNMPAAIDSFKKAIALNAGNKRIHNNLGIAYLINGDAEKGRQELAIGGADAWTVYDMAQLYYQNDMFLKAREHFARALEMNPSLAEARKGWEASDTQCRFSQALSQKEKSSEKMVINYPESALPEITSSLMERAGLGKQAGSIKQLQNVEIEIANGNGVRYMARDMGIHLKKKGFKVVRLTNADNFNHRTGSIIYDEKCLDAANAVAQAIPQIRDLKITEKRNRDDVKIKVLVGKDLIPYHKLYRNDRS